MSSDYLVPILMLGTLVVVLALAGIQFGWFLRKPENREHAKNALKQD